MVPVLCCKKGARSRPLCPRMDSPICDRQQTGRWIQSAIEPGVRFVRCCPPNSNSSVRGTASRGQTVTATTAAKTASAAKGIALAICKLTRIDTVHSERSADGRFGLLPIALAAASRTRGRHARSRDEALPRVLSCLTRCPPCLARSLPGHGRVSIAARRRALPEKIILATWTGAIVT